MFLARIMHFPAEHRDFARGPVKFSSWRAGEGRGSGGYAGELTPSRSFREQGRSGNMVERADISQLLSQMRVVQSQIRQPAADVAPSSLIPAESFVQPQQTPAFGELFSRAIDSVNQTQQQANRLREAYEAGQDGVSLTQVMIAAEKSSVAFEAMTQVRNKLVEAYQEIMNMPV